MEGDQVNQNGDQGNQDQNNQSLGWRSALPDEFKEHEFVKTFQKPGDFVKSALEIKTEHEALKTKLEGAIFKPGDDAKPEDREAYYRSLGKPERAIEYEFPKMEGGIEHDPKMIEWAQSAFHAANLTKEQAATIGSAWDGFVAGMVQAQQEVAEKARTEAEVTLKAELGSGYDEAAELTKRFLTKHASAEDLKFFDETKLGNHSGMIRLIIKLAKLTGEDISLQGGKNKGDLGKGTARDFYKT